MGMLRNDRQAVMANLHGLGETLLERLDDVRDSAVASRELQAALDGVRRERTGLVAELVEAERRAGELPHAGNREWAAVQALGDRFAGLTGGEPALVRRLLEGDQVWAAELNEAQEGEWDEVDARLLARLAAHLARTRERLEPFSAVDGA